MANSAKKRNGVDSAESRDGASGAETTEARDGFHRALPSRLSQGPNGSNPPISKRSLISIRDAGGKGKSRGFHNIQVVQGLITLQLKSGKKKPSLL